MDSAVVLKAPGDIYQALLQGHNVLVVHQNNIIGYAVPITPIPFERRGATGETIRAKFLEWMAEQEQHNE